MMEFKIIRLDTGGFVVKDTFFDNVFASTRIDEAGLMELFMATHTGMTTASHAQRLFRNALS